MIIFQTMFDYTQDIFYRQNKEVPRSYLHNKKAHASLVTKEPPT